MNSSLDDLFCFAVKELLGSPSIAYQAKHPGKAELAAWFHLASTIINLDETMSKP